MPYLSAITNLPWRFLLGLSCGLALALGYHSYVMRGIELQQANERAQQAISLQMTAAKAQREVSRIDQYWYDKMQRELAAVPNPRRVFVNAKCPSVPAAGDSSLDSGAGKPELDESGRQTLLDLRRGIVREIGRAHV